MASAFQLTNTQTAELLSILRDRFERHMHRHQDLSWHDVQSRLTAKPQKLGSLNEMEITGGEPDVVGYDPQGDHFLFYDCSPETPKGRRSICYDRKAWEARKAHRPENTAMDMAQEMGIELLTEQEYFNLQHLGIFDTKTSSWLKTPDEIRQLGGAIFGDRRFGRVFIYHNGADSYYGVRGFRGVLRL